MKHSSGIIRTLKSLVSQIKAGSATAEYIEDGPAAKPAGACGSRTTVESESPFIGDWRMGWFTWQKPDAEPMTTAEFFVRWGEGAGLHGWRVRAGGYTRFTGELRAGGSVWAGKYYRWDEGPFDPASNPYASFVFVLSDCGNQLMGAWQVTDRREGPQPLWAVRWRDSAAGGADLPGRPPENVPAEEADPGA